MSAAFERMPESIRSEITDRAAERLRVLADGAVGEGLRIQSRIGHHGFCLAAEDREVEYLVANALRRAAVEVKGHPS